MEYIQLKLSDQRREELIKEIRNSSIRGERSGRKDVLSIKREILISLSNWMISGGKKLKSYAEGSSLSSRSRTLSATSK